MKKIFIVVISIFIIVSFILSPISSIGKEPWKDPWKDDPEKNLYILINEGYKIINSTIAISVAGQFAEMIYLQKKNEIFRCRTMDYQSKSEHECQMLVNPKKNE